MSLYVIYLFASSCSEPLTIYDWVIPDGARQDEEHVRGSIHQTSTKDLCLLSGPR